MAGYTRQSTASIINGSSITAPPINAEFNQLLAAFNASSGHGHTGGTGDAPKIPLATSVSGYLPLVHGGVGGRNNVTNSVPGAGDDSADGYAPGSIWENSSTGRVYICVGNSSGAAVWRELVQVDSGNAILPASNDSVDLGNNSTRFQDLFLSGGISATGNVAIGGTLTTVGTSAFTGLATFSNLSATGTTTITSVDLNSGAIDNAVIGSATPAAGTFTTLNANTSLVAATADINGGTIDGAALGATTPSTGSFTTLGASGTSTFATVDINGGNIDGTVIGASTAAAGSFTTLSTTGQATLASADINGGSIDGSTIGANSASTGAFTTLTSSGGITGNITGNVTGNTAGVHTGNVTGNVTGNLTGNVTAGSGTSTFTNVTIDGTLNMNAGTSATIQNLTAPTNDLDAATKKYVDDEISTLIGDAGAGLDTLGELADALNDDDDFSTTVTNSIATKLPKAGGTMTGAIAMSTNKITGAGDPTSAQDVATKAYTDTQRDTRVAKTGDTMSGALAMGNNKITGLATPTAGTDVTNKTYVDGILGSATVAATSATNAATSETNAATSATNAATSATNAATSATNAASSYDQFDDRYLGAKSSAPTVDNDGDALITGALYFNSTSNIMYVYGGSGWQAAGSSVNGTSERNTYTATAGQTVFAAAYDTGYIDAYLNGVKLLVGTDFTATNGTSITLASGASVNDVVDIVAYGTFVLADHYTRTASDARYVNVAGDTMTGNLSFGTNNKAIFGAGSDLQIYHDGSHSYVSDVGTGGLKLTGGDIYIRNPSDQDMIYATSGGAVTLYHNNAPKLATTATGIDVTGTVTSDGLTSSGGVSIQNDAASFSISNAAVDRYQRFRRNSSNSLILDKYNGSTTTNTAKFDENGDISFYEDTGTTAKFFWDASAESLGIGTSSPSTTLEVNGYGKFTSSDNSPRLHLTGGRDYMLTTTASGLFGLYDNTASSYRLVVDSTGQVGIGTSSPTTVAHFTKSALSGFSARTAATLTLENSADTELYLASGPANTGQVRFGDSGGNFRGAISYDHSSDAFLHYTAGAEAMRIDSSGNVGIGQSLPSSDNGTTTFLHIGSSSKSASGLILEDDENQWEILSNGGLQILDGTAPRLTIDSSGQVGIGTSSPSALLEVASGAPTITLNASGQATNKKKVRLAASQYTAGDFNIQQMNDDGTTVALTAMTIMNGGNVGIGTSSPRVTASVIGLTIGNSTTGGSELVLRENTGNDWRIFNNGFLSFIDDTAERMRIDSSGNLLVGGTTTTPHTNTTTPSFALMADGEIRVATQNSSSLELNRTSSDGNIINLRKSGTLVGNIGAYDGGMFIGSTGGGVNSFMQFNNNVIAPASSTGTANDGNVSLGHSGSRFKDLKLSGGVYLGGTGAANKLDDYEEGTWTPQLNFDGSDNGITYTSRVGRYTKIGRMVYASFLIVLSNKGSVTGGATISGLPFNHFVGSQHSAANLIFENNGVSANQIGAYAMPWADGNLYLRYQGSTGYLAYTNANFNNSTKIFGMATYETTS